MHLIFSALKSGDGKTHNIYGLTSLIYKLNLLIELHKIGPDYIDNICVKQITKFVNINSHNYFTYKSVVWLSWHQNSSLTEDNMGMLDNSAQSDIKFNSNLLYPNIGIILILNCSNGMQTILFLSKLLWSTITAITLNNIISYKHEQIIKGRIYQTITPILFGTAVLVPSLKFHNRHLGIIPWTESTQVILYLNISIHQTYICCNLKLLFLLMSPIDICNIIC